ncbi:alpha/beta-tubulin-N-acetyltransferase 9 [Aedes albopictus]|uniref:N-acetyltransferase domain-containing protein n=1 Tax=Aedes albopictus TaxID=7160 RepID=A0ABM1Z0G6_AEDAL
MRLNEHLKIVGNNVILVPYESKHVPKYHEWMKSPELQELTASEPLSLEEEYQMQKSWREDDDKCTFLILDKAEYDGSGDEIAALIGDTNIFLQPNDSEEDDDGLKTGEIEIMIAEPLARGKRYGWESTLLMLLYGIKHLNLRRYKAITKDTNDKSMQMFTKMAFREVKRVPVFQEVTFEKRIDDEWVSWIEREISFAIEPYPS